MKRGKEFLISNRILYTLITLGVLSLFAVGVYATQQVGSGGGTHNWAEVGIPSCKNGQILKWDSGWVCGTDNLGETYISGGVYGYAMTYEGYCRYKGTEYTIHSPMTCPSGTTIGPVCPSGFTKRSTGGYGEHYYYYVCIKN